MASENDVTNRMFRHDALLDKRDGTHRSGTLITGRTALLGLTFLERQPTKRE